MGYSEDDSIVRVDVYKPSGKWSQTIAVKWLSWNGTKPIHDAFEQALLQDNHSRKLYEQNHYIFSCVHPYHEHAHPILLMPN